MRPRNAGFTLLELLIVLALMAIIAGLGIPNLFRMIARQKLITAARQASQSMQLARADAVKHSRVSGVAFLYASSEIVTFADTNNNMIFDAGTDPELGRWHLPTGIAFHGPTDANPGEANAMVGLTNETAGVGGEAYFRSDGSAVAAGAIRFRDERGNFLEDRIDPPATGRITVRKYRSGDPSTDSSWHQQGEDSQWQWS
jgi:prepilin-type N-terminal cleavage/methylation domain-containing protein